MSGLLWRNVAPCEDTPGVSSPVCAQTWQRPDDEAEARREARHFRAWLRWMRRRVRRAVRTLLRLSTGSAAGFLVAWVIVVAAGALTGHVLGTAHAALNLGLR